MNGTCTTVSLNLPMSWERFKTLPAGLQEEYLNHLQERFKVGLMNISQSLFGMGKSTLGEYIRTHNLTTKASYGKTKKSSLEAFQRWIDGEPKAAPVSDTTETAETTEAAETTETTTKIRATLDASETKPFRAHDFDEMLKAMGLEREATSTLSAGPEESRNVNIYPLKDLSMTLKGTPIDILAALRMSFPALLDKDRQYRFTIKVDDYVV